MLRGGGLAVLIEQRAQQRERGEAHLRRRRLRRCRASQNGLHDHVICPCEADRLAASCVEDPRNVLEGLEAHAVGLVGVGAHCAHRETHVRRIVPQLTREGHGRGATTTARYGID